MKNRPFGRKQHPVRIAPAGGLVTCVLVQPSPHGKFPYQILEHEDRACLNGYADEDRSIARAQTIEVRQTLSTVESVQCSRVSMQVTTPYERVCSAPFSLHQAERHIGTVAKRRRQSSTCSGSISAPTQALNLSDMRLRNVPSPQP
jgi:hypothetical protein